MNLSNDFPVRSNTRRPLEGVNPAAPRAVNATGNETAAGELLELFYPIHYRAGMALEDAMRHGRLTRTQVAILWLIRAEGGVGATMRRKDIERRIRAWFEITSSAITKSIRGMARAPLGLVSIVEDPHSAREKRVVLTARGKRFQSVMLAEGRNFLRGIITELSAEDVKHGIRFLRQAIDVLEGAEQTGQRNDRNREPG
jgi:DNA-binding MarR family transcriptional regulator